MTDLAFTKPSEAALALLNLGHRLTPAAGRFLGQLVVEDTSLNDLTEKQSDWLAYLLEKAGLPLLVSSVNS